jgi:plastocyanin
MVLINIGASGRRLYPPPLTWARLLQSGRQPNHPTGGRGPPPDPDRSATQPMPFAAARRLPRLLPLALAVALLGAVLVLAAGEPAGAQSAPSQVTIKGTAENKWEPADAAVKPGGTVTFEVAGGATHPVLSGTGADGKSDGKFDDSKCGLAQMSKVGDSCQVKFPKAGTFPYFCQIHVTLGMKGVITVGTSAAAATTTTQAAAGGAVVEPPSAAAPPSSGRPAIYWAGWGLFALGALLALGLIALYVRFWPGFNRPKS